MALREAGLWSRFTAFLLGRGSARRVWWLTLAMLGAGLGISHFLVDNGATPVVPITLSWWVFALIVAVIEFPLIHLYIRSEAHSFTLGELGLCLGLFLVPPEHFIIGAVVGATIAKFRLPPLKLAFNAALWVLQASVAVVVFQRIANLADPFGGWGVVATFGSMSLVGSHRRRRGVRGDHPRPGQASRWPARACGDDRGARHRREHRPRAHRGVPPDAGPPARVRAVRAGGRALPGLPCVHRRAPAA